MVSSSQGVPMIRSLLRPIACTLAVAILLMLGATTGSAFAHEIQHAAHHNAGMHATGICAWMCATAGRSEEHTSELQSRLHLVCRLLLEKKKKTRQKHDTDPL